ncbi:MAG: hypothetical protein ABIZ95_08765, partial [Pyrinomonadaceae bacterium]
RDQVINALERDLRAKEIEYLEPDPEDFATYPGYTVFRLLLPGQYTQFVDKWRDGSSYLIPSERTLANVPQPGSRPRILALANGEFITSRAETDFGFIRDLGDVPLDKIALTQVELQPLLRFRPPTDKASLATEHQRIVESAQDPDFALKSHAPAMVAHSYVLRGVDYGGVDLVIAFRVVREDTDHSLILIMTELRRLWGPLLTDDYSPRGRLANPCPVLPMPKRSGP